MNDGETIPMERESRQLLSRQGLDLTSPARGQLHLVEVDDALFDVFAYVIAMEGGKCDIMLGSKNAMMASAQDFVLPPAVLGDYVMLSPGLRATVPATSLGRGFAVLDERIRDRIDQALAKVAAGAVDLGFVRGCPYVSMADDRIAYRFTMSQELTLLRGEVSVPVTRSETFAACYALAAAPVAEPVSANCNVDGLDGTVHVRYSPADGHLMLRVYDPDGNRSPVLDGWGVFGQDATLLGTIEGAAFSCAFKDGFDGVLALVDEEGNVHPLQGGAEAP